MNNRILISLLATMLLTVGCGSGEAIKIFDAAPPGAVTPPPSPETGGEEPDHVVTVPPVLNPDGSGGTVPPVTNPDGSGGANPPNPPPLDPAPPLTVPPVVVIPPSVGIPPVVADDSIAKAMISGDASGLDAKAKLTLLQQAQNIALDVRNFQTSTLSKILQKNGADLSQALTFSNSSISVSLQNSTSGMSFLSADNGNGMAALTQVGTGRGMAYGADVLGWMAGTSTQQQHLPLFTRAFTWLINGDPDVALPTSLKFTTAGYSANNVRALLTRLGSAGAEQICDLTDVNNTCWQNADLLVFGGSTKDTANLTVQVQKYLAAGKAVIYMAPSWQESSGGRKVASAMGMELGGYPGNFYPAANSLTISASRTSADSLARADKMGTLIVTIQKLMDDKLDWDFVADASPTNPISQIHNELAALHGKGINLFLLPTMDLHKKLVLWADLWRPSIDKYGKMPPEQRATAADFLRAFASDSWVVFNRSKTSIAPLGYGDFMPKEAQNIAVSADWEDLDVTIAQGGGITAIGRAAIPGKTVTIQILDAAGGNLGVQSGYARSYGNPLSDGKKYAHPRRPMSFNVPIAAAKDNVFVTPFGGPLYLNYNGMSAGSVVKLRVKGAAKYGHFDFTKNMSQAEIDAASAAIKSKTFGWQTNKFVGGEVHQTNAYALSVIGNVEPKDYVLNNLRARLFDSNHIANGYSNMPMAAAVSGLCADLSWTCDGAMHRAPGVQHFIGWIAACGFLCSGNPSDGFAGLSAGWGWWHELGHNTVQRVHHIVPPGSAGCVVECDNNILSSASALRQYGMTGADVNGDRIDHKGLYQFMVDSRATGKTGEALRLDMQNKLWNGGQNAMRAVHFQLGFLYTKYRRGMAVPTPDASLEYLTLLTKGDRLVSKDWTVANAAKYGMGRYTTNAITNHDLLYVLSSKIIGKDMRTYFSAYGIPLDQKSLDSIADLNLEIAPLTFYALAPGKGNQVATGTWLDIEAATPAYPF
ncbi:ImpA family metalloprotease [Undibacterium sp.]|uniref:ImpA family metalloprotease n=1 Tax=Undibacterium sp. TaxID=1914977 RepID=UPI0025E502DE|nr:ImpA family metalloprotease [Undibacterium sp.]